MTRRPPLPFSKDSMGVRGSRMHRLMTPPSQFRDVFLPLKAQLQPVGAPFWSDPQKSVILQQQATFKGVACAIFTLERRSKGASGKSPLRQLWNRVPGGVPMGLMGTKSTQKRSCVRPLRALKGAIGTQNACSEGCYEVRGF